MIFDDRNYNKMVKNGSKKQSTQGLSALSKLQIIFLYDSTPTSFFFWIAKNKYKNTFSRFSGRKIYTSTPISTGVPSETQFQ